ncbi:uncharacterized protein BXZ73DRAFT_78034 [Epithele typhae]|uniref:uncharacterized protein n=1 Tax=Epithele typhae TaxID=378194 RepID=UPI00200790CA|nr:uncharacterized protein BXZ73DRAFT_78034 [Epithele typhae]KAH9929929.1 hypothetical protein BXZ73DRAFT_78034 [Epithele typhae]
MLAGPEKAGRGRCRSRQDDRDAKGRSNEAGALPAVGGKALRKRLLGASAPPCFRRQCVFVDARDASAIPFNCFTHGANLMHYKIPRTIIKSELGRWLITPLQELFSNFLPCLEPLCTPVHHIIEADHISPWNARVLPADAQALFIPSARCTVQDLLRRNFIPAPATASWKSTAPITHSTKQPDEPKTIPDWLVFVDQYSEDTAVTLLPGGRIPLVANSLMHPGAPGAHLPIWFDELWRQLSSVHSLRRGYLSAQTWVRGMRGTRAWPAGSGEEILHRLDLLPATDGIWRGAAPHLASSHQWFNCDVLDLVVRMLNADVRGTPREDKVRVFSSGVSGLDLERIGASIPRILRRAKLCEQATVYLPWHIGQQHWITVVINISNAKIMYADSKPSFSTRHLPDAKSKMLRIAYAIDATFGKPLREWKFDESSIACALQTDTNSCGLATALTIAHLMFSERRAWQPERVDEQRLSLLLQLLRTVPQMHEPDNLEPSMWGRSHIKRAVAGPEAPPLQEPQRWNTEGEPSLSPKAPPLKQTAGASAAEDVEPEQPPPPFSARGRSGPGAIPPPPPPLKQTAAPSTAEDVELEQPPPPFSARGRSGPGAIPPPPPLKQTAGASAAEDVELEQPPPPLKQTAAPSTAEDVELEQPPPPFSARGRSGPGAIPPPPPPLKQTAAPSTAEDVELEQPPPPFSARGRSGPGAIPPPPPLKQTTAPSTAEDVELEQLPPPFSARGRSGPGAIPP